MTEKMVINNILFLFLCVLVLSWIGSTLRLTEGMAFESGILEKKNEGWSELWTDNLYWESLAIDEIDKIAFL